MLTRLTIRNFKLFDEIDLELGDRDHHRLQRVDRRAGGVLQGEHDPAQRRIPGPPARQQRRRAPGAGDDQPVGAVGLHGDAPPGTPASIASAARSIARTPSKDSSPTTSAGIWTIPARAALSVAAAS